MKRLFRIWYQVVIAIAALLALTAATYAWFTSNKSVSTSTAVTRTGDQTLELQISEQGEGAFQSVETASISQVNGTDAGWLMPVSTADLASFVYSPSTVDGQAAYFQPVTDESNYFHGRIYVRAVGEGWPQGTVMNLYLDQSGGILGEAVEGQLLNAARLGLKFNQDASSAVILRLTENSNHSGAQVNNTVVNGTNIGSGQVLSYQNGAVVPVADPSVPVSDYTISLETDQVSIPDHPLIVMELGKVYTVDVYFYIEGCDPDCYDGAGGISRSSADIHLAFYGTASSGGVG